MPRFKDNAVCIRDLDWSETSQVVVLLTEAHGKIRGLAKGSKRQSPSSVARFSGGIELLTVGQVMATTRPTSELATITEWDLRDDCFALRRDLRAQRVAMYAADLCNALLADGDAHPGPGADSGGGGGAFAVMRGLLSSLCRDAAPHRPHPNPLPEGEGVDPELALLRFQWGLLVDCGYKPELERDVRGNGVLEPAKTYTFDPVAGGLTTQSGVGDWRVRAGTVEVLRSVAGEGTDDGGAGGGEYQPLRTAPGRVLSGGVGDHVDVTGDLESVRRANRLLCVYVRSVIDRELPTMGVVMGEGR